MNNYFNFLSTEIENVFVALILAENRIFQNECKVAEMLNTSISVMNIIFECLGAVIFIYIVIMLIEMFIFKKY